MSSYTIVHRERQTGYRIDVVGDDSSRNSLFGFDSEAQAKAWIAEDKQLEGFRQPTD